jgi:hypothetical protein
MVGSWLQGLLISLRHDTITAYVSNINTWLRFVAVITASI